MPVARILCFAGSTRNDSFNKKLAQLAANAMESAGAEVTVIDLRDFPLPLFDEDLESNSGMPEHASRLKQLFQNHHGILIASPEYNSSLSAVLKNALDWVSRREGNEPPKVAFLGKVAAIMSATPSGLGGIRGLSHLRSILQAIGMHVMPDQFMLSAAHQAFDGQGNLIDAAKLDALAIQMKSFVETVEKLQ
ncbi:MAG: NAD(P)H-dependent oxidoreductase [Planctomycetaceae bacterium]|nr:NAD(P)H-dependent oxidoreductase [Planctomycetaceae bacterium]